MKCSSCGKPLAAGANVCAGCGKAASGDYSYDVLPDEPKKEDAAKDAFMLPPGAALPGNMGLPGPGAVREKAPRGERMRAGSVNQLSLPYKKIGLYAGVALILVILGMRMCGDSGRKFTGTSDRADSTTILYATTPKVYPFQVAGEYSYTFTVEPVDGDVSFGVVPRSAKDRISPEVVKTWTLTPVRKGESQTLENTVQTGSYSFVIVTESKKAVKVKYKYRVK